jgi:hypothetical protein
MERELRKSSETENKSILAQIIILGLEAKLDNLIDNDMVKLSKSIKIKIKAESDKNTQINDDIGSSQRREKEEFENRLALIEDQIKSTIEEMDEKHKVAMASSGAGMAVNGLDGIIKSKVKLASKNILEQFKADQGRYSE